MTEHEAKIKNHHARCEFIDGLRRLKTRQGSFEAAFLHLDHPLPGGGRLLEASDRGKSAAGIRATAEEPPQWMTLWEKSAAKLPRTGMRILLALQLDWRTAVAARIACVSRPTVDKWKRNFRTAFADCHDAYRRDAQ